MCMAECHTSLESLSIDITGMLLSISWTFCQCSGKYSLLGYSISVGKVSSHWPPLSFMHVPEAKANTSRPKIKRPMANMAGICRTDRSKKQPKRALSTAICRIPSDRRHVIKSHSSICWWEWGYDMLLLTANQTWCWCWALSCQFKVWGNYDSLLT